MVIDVVATISPIPGKEARVQELISRQIANTREHEPNMLTHQSYKFVGSGGTTEFVVIQRQVLISKGSMNRGTG
jgi:hypothetical protein